MVSARNRDVSYRKARRRQRIDTQVRWSWGDPKPYYDNLHQYSKNKIHSAHRITKTRNKGSRRTKYGNYDRAILYSAADMRKVLSMDENMREEGYHAPKHQRDRFS